MKWLYNLFNPYKEAELILDNAPTCCDTRAEFITNVSSKYLYQCPKCKTLFSIFKYDMKGW